MDLADLKDLASSEIPGFNDRLKAFLPSLAEHHCSEGRPGGFYERLKRGTYLAHILEHVVLELQSLAGTPVKFGKTRMTAADGVYKMAVAYHDEEMGRAAVDAGVELVQAAVRSAVRCRRGGRTGSQRSTARIGQRPAAEAILGAARERRVPARLLDKSGLIQLGWGARQRRVLDGQTDATRPSPTGSPTTDASPRDARGCWRAGPGGTAVTGAEDAWAAAEEVGVPVLIRPKYVNALPPRAAEHT